MTGPYKDDDVLDTKELITEEKRSGWRYMVYRFPLDTRLSHAEEQSLNSLFKEKGSKDERRRLISTLKAVHRRDKENRQAKAAPEAPFNMANR